MGSLSANSFNSYQNFEAQIRDWKITADFDEKYAIPGSQTFAYIYQQALLIYLHAGFYASKIQTSQIQNSARR
jgi:hypothetical protein